METRRLRRFGALTLAAGLAFAAAGCKGKPEDAGTAVRKSDLRFLPRETAGLAVIEVGRFKDRAAVGRWLDDFTKEAGLTGGLDRVRAALGPDALDRLDRLSLALVPTGGTTGYAILAEGRFEEKTVKNLTGGGLVTLVEVGTSPDLSITALPQNHLALGPKAVLEQVRAAAGIAGAAPPAGGAPGKGLLDSPVMRVLDKVSPAKHVWGGIDYGVLSTLLGEAGQGSPSGASPMSGFTRNLRAVAFQGEIDSSVEFDLIGVADGEPGAKTLSDAARGLVAIARVGASQGANRAAESGAAADPAVASARAWMKFLDGVTIAQSKEEIRVHGLLDGTMAKSFADAASRSVPGVGAGAP
jgi:predicted transcriptional regulator